MAIKTPLTLNVNFTRDASATTTWTLKIQFCPVSVSQQCVLDPISNRITISSNHLKANSGKRKEERTVEGNISSVM